jgi:glycosyltransferase involved in cell wall biosynthesis
MRIILIGNYPPDKQESMLRFTQLLHLGFKEAGFESEIWQPRVYLGKWSKSANTGLGKWLGYIDKWIIFQLALTWRLQKKRNKNTDTRFHICDHSNAPYLARFPSDRTSITCHDVLAIRGALGYADAYCPASGMGKILQKWILSHLVRAKLLAADTKQTLMQLQELGKAHASNHDWRVIHIAFNDEFKQLDRARSAVLLKNTQVQPGTRFLLQVGSGITRKNRKLVIDMVAALDKHYDGVICFAGEAADKELLTYAASLGLQGRIISVERPDHQVLLALYSTSDALIFPSFSEGFGWPVIEAQACGTPVIASNLEPMPEVSGGAALHADPRNPAAFAAAWLTLTDSNTRQKLIQEGFKNALRFKSRPMIDAYLQLHKLERLN